MRASQPIECVSAALHAACFRDFPVYAFKDRDWPEHRVWMEQHTKVEQAAIYAQEHESGELLGPTKVCYRSVSVDDCELTVFAQSWGSTTLGYGGVGGAAVTEAYTVIVECALIQTRAVYFGPGGRLAYLIPMGGANEAAYRDALARRSLPARWEAAGLGWCVPGAREGAAISAQDAREPGRATDGGKH